MSKDSAVKTDFVIDGRKSAILKTVVDSYIDVPTPVASRVVHKKSLLGLSTATIRNEMHALEDAGYLMHTHTSSGRIPTDHGYHFFVDNFVSSNSDETDRTGANSLNVLDQSLEEIESSSVDKLLEQTVTLLSSITQHTAVIVKESTRQAVICDVHVTVIDHHRCIVALFFNDSAIQRIVLDSDQCLAAGFRLETLNDESNRIECIEIMKKVLIGRCLRDLTVKQQKIVNIDTLASALIDLIIFAFSGEPTASGGDATVRIAGVANIAKSPAAEEGRSSEISAQLLTLIEQHMVLIDLIRHSVDQKIGVKIGSENSYDELANHSLVLAPFSTKEGDQGTVGIIGPTRMDYSKVFGILNGASVSVAKYLDQK